MQKLPIGIQSFNTIINDNFLYVDKTMYYKKLIETGQHLFLARPRRFGKSLMLSTLKALFEGKKELFKGLWIEKHWDWTQKSPVLLFDLNQLDTQAATLDQELSTLTQKLAREKNILLESTQYKWQFIELLEKLHQQSGRVVVLIDEYDKPITDFIENPEKSAQNLKILKSFFGVLKSMDHCIQFNMITGISKYGKVAIFSDLNNLADLTLNSFFNEICGYTDDELQKYFKPFLREVAESYQLTDENLLKWVKYWYNGYSWDGKNTVYTPFSILNFLQNKKFNNYWFETGTPSFLTQLLKEEQIQPQELEALKGSEILFSSADLWNLDIVSLLIQTGYLTVKKHSSTPLQQQYTLGFPNREVQLSFYKYLLAEYLDENPVQAERKIIFELQDTLQSKNWKKLILIINKVFASVPYQIFENSEAYYHSLIHVMLKLTGFYFQSESSSSQGRSDSILEIDEELLIFEFKMDSTAEKAIQQIKNKKYSDAYNHATIYLIGINFNSEERKITDWQVEAIQNL